MLWEIVPDILYGGRNMSKKLITLEEANELSVEKIELAIGVKGLQLVELGMSEDEAKIFAASLINLGKALANKNL